jgi:type VI secretion system protein ImpK
LGQALAPWAGDLEVIGHTDIQPIQSAQFPSNQALSEARASAAAQALRETTTKLGARSPGTVVDREITSSGRGDTEPVDKNKTPAAFERNRRVDVLWKVIPGLHVEKRTPLTSNVDVTPPASSANSLTVRY